MGSTKNINCAYNLSIDTFSLVQQLKAKTESLDWSYQPYYFDYKTLGTACYDFYKLFEFGFLNTVRISKTPAYNEWKPHLEVEHVKGNFANEIHHSSIIQVTINVLLGDSSEDKTLFYLDTQLNKYYHLFDTSKDENYTSYETKKQLYKVDEWTLTDKPMLLYTGTWHSIAATKDRWVASFMFHPYISFETVRLWLNQRGLVDER
jgi:hypothetical protein